MESLHDYFVIFRFYNLYNLDLHSYGHKCEFTMVNFIFEKQVLNKGIYDYNAYRLIIKHLLFSVWWRTEVLEAK